MTRKIGAMKDPATPFCKYLNQDKVYVSPAVLGLVDTHTTGVMLQTDPQLTFRDDIKASIMDIMNDNTSLSVFAKRVRELKPANGNPRSTNGLTIQVAIKEVKDVEAYTEKRAKAMDYINDHDNHPVLSQCVFVLFGRGAAIDQNNFHSLIRMQNEFLHNVKHVKSHGLFDIDTERHRDTDTEDDDEYANTIREALLEECDIDGQRIFHSIERTIKSDTTRAIFSKQNEILCNSILSYLYNWLTSKFIGANNNLTFRKSDTVRVFISIIDQRKNQNQVKYNAYASHIAKHFCTENPNEASESFDTASAHTPKRCINIYYADAAAMSSPTQEQSTKSSPDNVTMPVYTHTQQIISVSSNGNNSRLDQLIAIIQSITFEQTFYRYDFKSTEVKFEKIPTSALQHPTQIQAIQTDMHILHSIVLKLHNGLLPNAPPTLPQSTFSSMRITDDLSTLTSTLTNTNAPSSPQRKTPRGDELASPPHISTTWDSQKESGRSSDSRECEMNAPRGSEKY
jgi:hypothetical protein